MKSLLAIVNFVCWLWKRLLKRKDANEPQQRIDDARKAAVEGDDAATNAALARARDKCLLDAERRTGDPR